MKQPPSDPEFAKFTDAMRVIMGVSKKTLNKRIAEEKKGKRLKRPASPGPASSSTSAT
jgi:hypothetical protein